MSNRIVQCSSLGNFGRFGNQLFQYVFARAYAEKYNAVLELPPWIGSKIFNLKPYPITRKLPRTQIDKIPWGETNVDLFGYFQTKECYDILSEKKIREWLIFQKRWLSYLMPSTEIVAHRRIGDYASLYSNIFCIISKESYIKNEDSSKIIWVSEEKATNDPMMNDISYSNTPSSRYGNDPFYKDKGISFLPDFFRMTNAKVLLRANSTFSFWAGFFNTQKVYSPVVKGLVGEQDVKFVEGNHSAICNVTDDINFGV